MSNFDFQTLKNLHKCGRYTDPKQIGLHLWVKSLDKKYWILRNATNGKQRDISLGSFPTMPITEARERAQKLKKDISNGIDPILQRKLKRTNSLKTVVTFKDFASKCIELKRAEWRNPKHANQWIYTIEKFAYPHIANKKLDEIETEDILKILTPIWNTKTVTASRLRGRLEWILSSATTRKLRSGINPALWRGHLQTILPAPNKINKIKHHKALSYRQIPLFMKKLRDSEGMAALALEFLILNASRTGEVIGGLRSEVDNGAWTIPASRMKASKEHQVTLCRRSLELIEIAESLEPNSEYLFSRNNKKLSNMAMPMLMRRLNSDDTVHGFRSTFRDWVSEETGHSSEVAEMALAHTIPSKTERAYRRGDLREPRRALLQEWQDYCLSIPQENVLELKIA
jgi:integrase